MKMSMKLKTKKTPLMRHLLTMESLDQNIIGQLLDKADLMLRECVDKGRTVPTLAGKIVANLFFEPSTRTLNSFEIAAKRLGAICISPDISKSATVKGESLIDTIHTFEAMGTDYITIRHSDNNTAQFVASELKGATSIINAGDGVNQHPTQGLLDLLTIRQNKNDFTQLSVAIIGDIAHSRVARSLIAGLRIMNTPDIRIIAPAAFMPADSDELGVTTYTDIEKGLRDVDVVVTLRIQKERIDASDIPDNEKYFKSFGITNERVALAKPDAIVMHPGPMNRGIEIESSVADGIQSRILQQVRNGVAIRMAIMESMLAG